MPHLEELANLIEIGREDRSLEYKESRTWDELKNKISKTALGMANIRDGGTIVIGVSERSGSLVPQGMPAGDIDTYNEDDPVICKRSGVGLRKGAVYTRSYRMPETCEVPSQTEMREIIDMATDKEVRRFLERLRRAGLLTAGTVERTGTEKYDEELEGL